MHPKLVKWMVLAKERCWPGTLLFSAGDANAERRLGPSAAACPGKHKACGLGRFQKRNVDNSVVLKPSDFLPILI